MKIIQNSLLLLLLLAFALAGPMDSSENEGGPGELNELKKFKESDNTLNFKELLTLETWSPQAENEDRRVYLQPNDEDDTNRDEFMEKFTVGSEIFNQLPLIKNQLVLDDSDLTTAYEIQLPKVESNILTALLNFASFISTNKIELDKFRYL